MADLTTFMNSEAGPQAIADLADAMRTDDFAFSFLGENAATSFVQTLQPLESGELDTEGLTRRLAELMVADIALGGELSTLIADLTRAIGQIQNGQAPAPELLAGIETSYAAIQDKVYAAATGAPTTPAEKAAADKAFKYAMIETADQVAAINRLPTQHLRDAAFGFVEQGHDPRHVANLMDTIYQDLIDSGLTPNDAGNGAIIITDTLLDMADVSHTLNTLLDLHSLATPEEKAAFAKLQQDATTLSEELSKNHPEIKDYFDRRSSFGSTFHAGDLKLLKQLQEAKTPEERDALIAKGNAILDAMDPLRQDLYKAAITNIDKSDAQRAAIEAFAGKPLEEIDWLKEMPASRSHEILGHIFGNEPLTLEEMLDRINERPQNERGEALMAIHSTTIDASMQIVNFAADKAITKGLAEGKEVEDVIHDLVLDLSVLKNERTSDEQKRAILERLGLEEAKHDSILSMLERNPDALTKESVIASGAAAASHLGETVDIEKTHQRIDNTFDALAAQKEGAGYKAEYLVALDMYQDEEAAYNHLKAQYNGALPDNALLDSTLKTLQQRYDPDLTLSGAGYEAFRHTEILAQLSDHHRDAFGLDWSEYTTNEEGDLVKEGDKKTDAGGMSIAVDLVTEGQSTVNELVDLDTSPAATTCDAGLKGLNTAEGLLPPSSDPLMAKAASVGASLLDNGITSQPVTPAQSTPNAGFVSLDLDTPISGGTEVSSTPQAPANTCAVPLANVAGSDLTP